MMTASDLRRDGRAGQHLQAGERDRSDGRDLDTQRLTRPPAESARRVLKGTLVAIEDVTERIRLEEQLRQNDKLSSIGLLAAGVAHEVNTPLTGISSYSQMLMQQIPESDSRHQLLQKIYRTDIAGFIVGNQPAQLFAGQWIHE
jgi:signal transduction histidine kinase